MQSIVKTGKTVDEAVQAALEALDATLDDVSIEIMEEAKSGFLGVFGSKEAIVRVSRKESPYRELLEEKDLQKVEKEAMREESSVSSKEANEEPIVSATSAMTEETSDTSASETRSEVETKTASSMKAEEKRQEEQKTQEIPNPLPRETKTEEKSTHSLLDLIHEEVEREHGKKGSDSPTISTKQSETSTADASMKESTVAPSFDGDASQETTPAREMDNVEIIRFTENWLSAVLREMHISAQLNFFIEEENLRIEMTDISETDMGIVIGRRAETLNAIQYLLGVTLNRISKHHYRVYLDVGDYRKRRAQNITRLAERNAEKVKRSKRPLKLEPMNAYERRIVHTALQNMEHIETVSEGREPYRKVVILYKE